MSEEYSDPTQERFRFLFETPVFAHNFPDSDAINADLKRAILEKERLDQGASKSDRGGWNSEVGLFSWQEACVAALKEQVASVTRQVVRMGAASSSPRKFRFSMNSWANVLRHGNYSSVHSHQGATWSGVYYVSAGDADNDDPENGKLELFDPRAGANIEGYSTQRHLIHPIPGLIIFFPSWLKHMVHPFSGSGERISITFNVNVEFEN